jgi:hypothetical protein
MTCPFVIFCLGQKILSVLVNSRSFFKGTFLGFCFFDDACGAGASDSSTVSVCTEGIL